MSAWKEIAEAYGWQFLGIALLLALIPLVKFLHRHSVGAGSLTKEEEAELFPLWKSKLLRVLYWVFGLAFAFERPLRDLDWPPAHYLSRAAPGFFLLLFGCLAVRAFWLLRKLPVAEQARRSGARLMMLQAGWGVLVVVLAVATRGEWWG